MPAFEHKIADFVFKRMSGTDNFSNSRHNVRTGRVFWVLPSTKTNFGSFVASHPSYKSGNGVTTVASVYTTIQTAIDACVASQDDVIFVDRSYTEAVTATSHAHNKANVSIIGLGSGENRPALTFGAAAATITVSKTGAMWENFIFIANFANVASAFTLTTATGCVVKGSTFYDTGASLNFLCCVTTSATDNAADGLNFLGNEVFGLATTDGACVSMLQAASRVKVNDNFVNKAATNDAGHLVTLSSKIMTDFQCLRNTMVVVGSSGAAVGILLTGSGSTSTGVVGFNNVWSLDTTGGLLMTASTGLRPMGNYLSGAVDKQGTLSPTADDPA